MALKEVAFAVSLNKRLAPIVCRTVAEEPIPEALARLHFIDFVDAARFEASADLLATALQTDIAWIRRHTEIGDSARKWAVVEGRRPHGLLLRSPALEEAERWIASRPTGAPAPTENTKAFIAESRRAATQRQRWAVGGSLAAASLAGVLAIFALVQRQEAAAQRDLALKNEAIAQENERHARRERDAALTTQSRFLADLASQHRDSADGVSALLLAHLGLPDRHANAERPNVAEAESMLYGAKDDQREIAVFPGHSSRVTTAFAVGNQIVSVPLLGPARLWDGESGRQIAVLGADFEQPKERRLHITIMDTAGDAPHAAVYFAGARDHVTVLAWEEPVAARAVASPEGRRIVTLPINGKAQLWDAVTGEEIAVLGDEQAFHWSAAFSPDGARLVVTSLTGSAQLREAATGKIIAPLVGHDDAVWIARFSPDGRRIATASWDSSARIWDGANGRALAVLEGHERAVVSLAFSPDGARLATADMIGGPIVIWNVESGKPVSQVRGEALGRPAFNSDGSRILTVAGWEARLWSVDDGKEVAVLEGHQGRVVVTAYSPVGDTILTASMDGTARIFNATTGQHVSTMTGHQGPIWHAGFIREGRGVLTASKDGTAREWNPEDGSLLARFRGHRDEVWSVAAGPDPERIVTASLDKTARLWTLETARLRASVQAYGGISGIAVSPDGSRLLVLYLHDFPQLRNVATGRKLVDIGGGRPPRRPDGDREAVWSAAFHPDGNKLATFGDAVRNLGHRLGARDHPPRR